MADFISDFMNWLSSGTIGGLPVIWVFIGVGTLIFITWLILTRERKLDTFKARDFEKEYENYMKTILKKVGDKINTKWYLDGVEKGMIRRLVIYNDKAKIPMIVNGVASPNKFNLLEDKVYIFSYSPVNILGKLGLKEYIVMIDEKQIVSKQPYFSVSTDKSNFEPYTKNIFLLTKKGEKPAERFVELDTIKQLLGGQINYLPKIQFHDTGIGATIAKLRENADIESKKFRGQQEAATD